MHVLCVDLLHIKIDFIWCYFDNFDVFLVVYYYLFLYLAQVVAIIPKNSKKSVIKPNSQSRKYLGPVKYPVTPIRALPNSSENQRLSLLADDDEHQVYI